LVHTAFPRRLGCCPRRLFDMEPEDGLVTAEELRQVLLAVFSNCTYRVQRATDKLWCELPLNSSLVGSTATVPRVCFNATQGECNKHPHGQHLNIGGRPWEAAMLIPTRQHVYMHLLCKVVRFSACKAHS
jgi:hypothetical protein